jgi:vitamin B12/bleomycin/antimicrobial peptide transport system ATP-binding/permease protein
MQGIILFVRDAWRLAWPYYSPRSEERWSARGLLLLNVVLKLGGVGGDIVFNFWNKAWFDSIQEHDWASFIALLTIGKYTDTMFMPGFCAFAALLIVIAVIRVYVVQLLQIRWRRWLTQKFVGNWLKDRAYYRIGLADSAASAATHTDNPDQRVAEDIRDFIGDAVGGTQGFLYYSVDLLATIVSLGSFIAILWGLSGQLQMTLFGIGIPGYLVWLALIYSVLGTWLTHLVGRRLIPLNFNKQRVEADFRFALMRIRENAEGIALYAGEADEERGLFDRFAALVRNWRSLMRRQVYLNTQTTFYAQVASVLPYVIASPAYFTNKITLGALQQTADAFGQVQNSMSWVVNAYNGLASWRATVVRLTSFWRAIELAQLAKLEGVHPEPGATDGYALHDATLTLPDGTPLLEQADIELAPGQPILFSGRSGAGKSTLFRAFAGIWPFGSGRVRRPRGTSLFLPQRPYIPLGTLRHAVSYPAKDGAFPDEAVATALKDAGLEALIPRLDVEDNWTMRLSGGEQQRLALARALLVRPDWLFLDEATANLDPEAEAALYVTIRRRLPATTIVSIAHRPAVGTFHQRHLVLQRGPDGPGRLIEAQAEAAE